jgi:FAD/FMN-containing dehydrogenase
MAAAGEARAARPRDRRGMSITEETIHVEADLPALRRRLRGEALTPADAGYANVRPPFNAMHADRPDLVVLCLDEQDVAAAVDFARERAIEVTVRGGGHSIAGFSSSVGGMVIDLAPMAEVKVDPQALVARVGGGALWADVDGATQAFGLATPGGLVSDTGVAGLTLGGGYGWLRRKHGLSCDNLLSVRIVSADGHVRTASPEVEPNLFWAIRGGGGNFGIVTSFTFRLHPVGPVVPFAGVFYPVDEAAAVLRGFRAYCDGAPDDVTTEATIVTIPADPELPEVVHGRACVVVEGMYAGDVHRGMRALQPLRELGTSIADGSGPMPFTVVQSSFDAVFPRGGLRSYWKALFVAELSDAAVEALASRALVRPSPVTMLAVMQMGGAIARVGAADTALCERTAAYCVGVGGNWTDPAQDGAQVAWVRETWSELSRFGTGSTYLNFSGRAGGGHDAGVDEGYGRNLRRLGAVKTAYDPGNLFRRNHNIAPAGG